MHEVSNGPRDPASNVKGLVVNKPMTLLKHLLRRAQSSEDKEWANSMLEAITSHGKGEGSLDELGVYKGGPIVNGHSIQQNLHWLHGFPQITGASQVAPGLWIGGDIREILDMVGRDEVQSHSIPLRICFGYSCWTDLQLRLELESGVWTRARALDDWSADNGALSALVSSCFSDAGTTAWQHSLQSAGLQMMASFPRNSKMDDKLKRHIAKQESQAQLQMQTDSKDVRKQTSG